MAFLKVSGISKLENGNCTVCDINVSLEAPQKIAVAGETGSGKTTLLKMIAGLAQPDAGEITFLGNKVLGPLEKLIPGHPGIAYQSQHFELRNNYRVEEELEALNRLPADQAHHLYELCRVQHLMGRKTNQLSGGERQRIVLARLLSTSPQLLLLDEPFSNLDARHKGLIKSILQDVTGRLGIGCLLVSHDGQDLLSWADQVIVMREGRIIQQDNSQNIYQHPVDEYCAGLFGDYNLVDLHQPNGFATVPGVQTNRQYLLLRPEQVYINQETSSGIKGVVRDVLYWGSYYTADVAVGHDMIRARTSSPGFSINDTVFLSFSTDNLCYF